MTIHCPACGHGPFDTFRALQSHKRHCGRQGTTSQWYNSVDTSVTLPPPQAATGNVAASLPVNDLPSEVPPEVAFYESMTLPTPPASPSEGGIVMDANDNELDEPEDDDENQDIQKSNVLVRDTNPLPDVIKKAMFQIPEGTFGPTILKDTLTADDGIRFRGNMWNKMTPEEKSNLHLLKILKGQDLSLFKEIQEWRFQSKFTYGLELSQRNRPTSRTMAIRQLQKIYGYNNLLPNVKEIELPNTGVKVDLIVFPFGKMFLSLITDPDNMQPENIYFDPSNPFSPPKEAGNDGFYDDFHTGSVHCGAHKRYCTDPNDILAEIALFIDKTHIDGKGKHTLEPVMFTTTLFKRSRRNQHKAWRPLGYIPNLDLLAPHADAEKKQMDYHYCLRIIFSELAAYQEIGGLEWTFAFGDKEIPCRLQIPVNSIMGDTDGHDKLCARKLNRSGVASGRLCRYCDVTFANLGQPLNKEKTKLTKSTEIRQCRNRLSEADKKRLDTLGYRHFHDGAVDLHFSDPVRGLHGCTPGEILHAFQLGIAERSIEGCFGARKIKQK